MPGPHALTGMTVADARIVLPVTEHTPLRDLPPGVERSVRIDLRYLLRQADGSHDETNAIADELADVVLRNFDVRLRSQPGIDNA